MDFKIYLGCLFCVLPFFGSRVHCSNILGIFPTAAYSHYTLGHRLLEVLAEKGHNVTMIAPYKQNKKIQNYHEIYLEGLADIIKDKKSTLGNFGELYPINQIIFVYNMGFFITEFTLNYKSVLNLIKSNQTFDVVIMDQFLNEGMTGIAHELNASIIYLSALVPTIWNNHLVGNPAPLSYIPNIFLNYKGSMDFYQRFYNFFLYVAEELYRRYIAFPIHNKILHEVFPNAPELNELLYKKNSFILVNSHTSITDPVPHVPNMIEIGGFHLKLQEVSKGIKRILDESVEGIVFFSLGSNFNSTLIPNYKRKAILNAFGKLKQKVLWKWDGYGLFEKPDNVIIDKWYQQQAILAHPNTKAFISHGGILSTIEAVHYGVPIIGLPIFADQIMNVNIAANRGYGISLDFEQLTEEILSEALDKILKNKTYKENARLWSVLLKDRLVNPIKEAIYWVEYVIRYKGASHFRSKAMDLKWYQYEMLDVALAFLLIALAFLLFISFIIKYIMQKKFSIKTKFCTKQKKIQ